MSLADLYHAAGPMEHKICDIYLIWTWRNDNGLNGGQSPPTSPEISLFNLAMVQDKVLYPSTNQQLY